MNIKCPFCSNQKIENISGNNSCPKCHAKFEIDDRGECIFVDLSNPQMPVSGTVCMGCGLFKVLDAKLVHIVERH